jgi:hypothetical protein
MKITFVLITALLCAGCAPRVPAGYADASRPAPIKTIIVSLNNRGL